MNYSALPNETTINFRCPIPLKEELLRRAGEERRSLGNYVVGLLDEAIAFEAAAKKGTLGKILEFIEKEDAERLAHQAAEAKGKYPRTKGAKPDVDTSISLNPSSKRAKRA